MSDSRKLKSRRSSILKPPKPRNPLSDVDLNPPDTTIIKSRRVSFAHVHFKKEFTSDPEQNTIWHVSYEEEMKKSDKLDLNEVKNPEQNVSSSDPDINMSVEDMSLDCDIMNCTQANLNISFETALASNSCDTSVIGETIDLTEHHNKKAPKICSLRNHPNFQEVETLSLDLSQEVAMEKSRVSNSKATKIVNEEINPTHSSRRQTVHFQQESAELDLTIPVPPMIYLQENRKTINFHTNSEEAIMDMTQAVGQSSTKRQTIHFNNESQGETMEITKSIPSHVLLNLNKGRQNQKRQTINFQTSSECGNMDLTQAVSTEIAEKENQFSAKRQTIHFNNETGATMEITQSLTPQMILNLKKVRDTQKRHTINFETNLQCGNMDLTQAVSTEIAKKENQFSAKRQTIHFNNETEGATMEITQSVTPQMILNLNKVRDTQKRHTINFKTSSECGNMDITQAVATEIAEIENNFSTEGPTIEISRSNMLSNLNKVRDAQKRQTINFKNNTECDNLDTTEVVPTGIIENYNQCPAKRQTIHFNNEVDGAMELTETINPQTLAYLNRQSQKRQTECGIMEITQAVSTEITEKENQFPAKRQTTHFNNETEGAIMELTQSVPSNMHLTKTKHCQLQQKRQTINYQQQEGNMDLTQGAQKEIQFPAKRQTMHFNNETEGAIIEMTQQKGQTINYQQQEGNMDLTQAVEENNAKYRRNRQTIHFNNETEGATMEMTQAITPQTLLKLNHQAQKRQTINVQTNPESGFMDITQAVPTEINEKENHFPAKRQTLHFNNETEGATMELTQSVPPNMYLTKIKHCQLQQKRQTINYQQQEGNMDLTQTAAENNAKCRRNRQTIHFNKETEEAGMELTQPITPQTLLKLNRQTQKRQTINVQTNPECGFMDITQAVSTEITEKENQFPAKRQTTHFNNETEGATMELTQSVPPNMYLTNNKHCQLQQKRQTINYQQEGNMDLTQAAAENIAKCRRNRQTIHFNNETEEAGMEMTQPITPQSHLIFNRQAQKRQAINYQQEEGNMDLTQAVEENNAKCRRNRQTIHFNSETEGAAMEMTQAITPQTLLKLNCQAQKRQTINVQTNPESGFMDITQAVSTEITEKENQFTAKRQIMHFNNEMEGGAMELTQSVPPSMYLINTKDCQLQQKRQTINYQQEGNMNLTQAAEENNAKCGRNRQTIHFNNETEGAIMEITQPITPQQKRQTINYQQQEGNMDLTQVTEKENQFPAKRQTMHFNNETEGAGMELTQPITPQTLLKFNRQTQNRKPINVETNAESGILDITQAVPTEINEKENQFPAKRQTIHFNNETEDAGMELTQSVPPNRFLTKAKDCQLQQKRQTINYQQQNMDLTQAAEENHTKCKRSRQTVHSNNETKDTANTGAQIKKRQTINFKNSSEGGIMDITQAVSSEIDEKENQFSIKRPTMQVSNTTELIQSVLTKKSPINFNISSKTTEMDIRETVNINNKEKDNKYHKITPMAEKISELGKLKIDLVQKAVYISKIVQDAHNFTNICLETNSASIKTVETYFPVSPKSATETVQTTTLENLPPVNFENTPAVESREICLSDQTVDNIVSDEKIDTTPVKNEPTDKILICESEYCKTIVNKNYSIVDTSFPDELEISELTDNSRNMSNLNVTQNTASIISVNSSVESVEVQNKNVQQETVDEFEIWMKEIKPPPKIDYSFNLEEELAKIHTPQVIIEEQVLLRKLLSQPDLSLKEQMKISYNIDLDRFNKKKNDTQTLIYPQIHFEDKVKPNKIYQKFEELVKKRNEAQEARKQTNKKLSLEDKIKRMINKDTLWKLIPNEDFSFTFMGNSIKVIAQVDRDSQMVEHVEFIPQIDESTCRPIWIYVHRIQKVKLSESNIKSAIGQNYTIFTLLDYLTKIGEELMVIFEEFDYLQFNIGAKLDRNLNATLVFTNLFLRLAFEITVNLNNLNNTTETVISVKNLVGSADENALKRLVKHCPPGFTFLREYDRQVKDYLKIFQQSRQK